MRVLDLSTDVAGGFCTKLLAMNGSDVLRVAEDAPDWTARYLHAHKRVLSPAEVAAEWRSLPDLARTCQVVVTTFEAGQLVGTPARDLAAAPAAREPTTVHLTTSSFGTEGPYAGYRSDPLVDWAAGGYLFITGDPSRPPLAGPETLCGYVAGYTAAVAVEGALRRRHRTGLGCRLDISTMESMLSMHQSTFSRLGAGMLRTRTGRYTEVFPLVVLPCADGHVSLGVVTDDEFDRLTLAMGRPDLALDERFSSGAGRTARRAELEPILRSWLAPLRADEVVALLHEHGLASAKVSSPAELLANEQLAERRFWETVVVDGRPARMPGNPLGRLSAGDQQPIVAEPVRSDPVPTLAGAGVGGGADLPLGGPEPVVVLDLTAFWAGPSATRNLADLGAEVIRVERPGSRLDFAAAPSGDPVQALFDHKTNRHKRSVVVDLRQPAGRDLLLGLVERADVLVDNYRAGVMEALGLGHQVLSARNPRLVHVALSGFGGRGPWAAWKSYGPTIEAASSIEYRTRYPGSDEPLRLGHTLPDGVGGLVGTYAALVGLRHRDQTGRGVHLDVSQLEAYCALSGEELLAYSSGDRPDATAEGPPVDSGDVAPGVYPCRGDDEWVVIAARRPEEQAVAVQVLGLAPGEDPRPVTACRDKVALAGELQAAGVAAFPALRADELVADEQLRLRRYFVEVPFDGRSVPLPGSPFRGRPPLVSPEGDPPAFGADTAAVLAGRLGLSESEIGRLHDQGAVFCAGRLRPSSPRRRG